MSKFKPGDRVRVYGHLTSTPGRISFPYGLRGTVTDVLENELLVLIDGDKWKTYFHSKQCRKLKPKKKAPEPRRVWLTAGKLEELYRDGSSRSLAATISNRAFLPNDKKLIELTPEVEQALRDAGIGEKKWEK